MNLDRRRCLPPLAILLKSDNRKIMFSRAALALGLLLPWSSLPGQTESVAPTPSDAEIRQILIDRIDRDSQGVGIAVGVIDAKGHRVIAYGTLAKDDRRQIDGDTIFEIGSVTKVFTSLLLMDMVQRGEVALTDPVSKFLPSNVKMPERNGKKITLADLSTQTSGLPLMPANMRPKDPMNNPYADYTVDRLYRFPGMATISLPRRPMGAESSRSCPRARPSSSYPLTEWTSSSRSTP
jgi:CubicO group peptidase (beta-lactamase class C family)